MNAAYRLRCDISGCRNVAKYGIGSPGSGKGTHFLICEECVKSLVESLPDELKPIIIVEVEKEVENEEQEKYITDNETQVNDIPDNETQEKDIPDNETKIKDSLDLIGDMLTPHMAEPKDKEKSNAKAKAKAKPKAKTKKKKI